MILLLAFPTTAHEGTRIGIQLFTTGLLPYLLPYLILTGWLLRLTARFDTISRSILYAKIYIISAFGGFPTGSYVVSHYFERHALSKKEAATLLAICHFPSPLFTVGFIGNELLQQPAMMWRYLCFLHFISIICIIITYYYFRHEEVNKNPTQQVSNPLLTSIKESVPTLGNVAVTIIFFSTVVSITRHIISFTTENKIWHLTLTTLLEMTQALQFASQNITESYRLPIIILILSIQGISIHTQVAVIAKTNGVPLKRYIFFRIGTICITGLYVILKYF